MTFSEAYGDILLPFLDNYKEAKNEKGRNEVIKNAAEAVKEAGELLEETGIVFPKDLNTVRFLFFIDYYRMLIN